MLNLNKCRCVQCVTAGCHWFSSEKRCDWTNRPEAQLHGQVGKCLIFLIKYKKLNYTFHTFNGKVIYVCALYLLILLLIFTDIGLANMEFESSLFSPLFRVYVKMSTK